MPRAVVTAIIIIVAEGFTWLAIWNLVPVFLSALLLSKWERRSDAIENGKTFGFVAGVCLFSGALHVGWIFDIGRTQTGSSTSALIFIFIPIYSMVDGLIGGMIIGALLGRIVKRNAERGASSA